MKGHQHDAEKLQRNKRVVCKMSIYECLFIDLFIFHHKKKNVDAESIHKFKIAAERKKNSS